MTTSELPVARRADVRTAVGSLVDRDVLDEEQARAVLAALDEVDPAPSSAVAGRLSRDRRLALVVVSARGLRSPNRS